MALIIVRLWRFVRIGHGIFASTHSVRDHPRSPEITRDHPDTVHGLLASTHSIQERARWPEDG